MAPRKENAATAVAHRSNVNIQIRLTSEVISRCITGSQQSREDGEKRFFFLILGNLTYGMIFFFFFAPVSA